MKNNIIGMLLTLIFMSCNPGYQKENGKWVWISFDEAVGKRVSQIDKHDYETFEVLNNGKYAKDKNSVFYIKSKIENADPKTFETIKRGYSKDNNHIFLDDEVVIHANPKTFQLLEFPYSKDDLHVFCGTVPLNLKNEEIEQFQVTNNDELLTDMKSSIVLSHFIELNPEYEWLDTLGIKGVIVGEFATGETNDKKFKGFKGFKK